MGAGVAVGVAPPEMSIDGDPREDGAQLQQPGEQQGDQEDPANKKKK